MKKRIFGQKIISYTHYKGKVIAKTKNDIWILGFGIPTWAESDEDAKDIINFLKRSE